MASGFVRMVGAFEKVDRSDIKDNNVQRAVSGLVRVSSWGNAYLVTLPLVYPSGAMVGVRVSPNRGRYWISDFAMGYREAENIDAHRSFGAHAGRMKDALGVEYTDNHEIGVMANPNRISSSIRRVGYATHRIMTKVFEASPTFDEQELGAVLFRRLSGMFGMNKVAGHVSVLGASNIDWNFTACVKDDHRKVFFDIVTPHHSSVFSAVSKFSDVKRLGADTHTVAVVPSFEKMGKWLPLIVNETDVIESGASDDNIRKAVAEAA